MILGLGTDIVAVDRIGAVIRQHGARFLERCFRPAEIELADGRGRARDATIAVRWAAREAFLKALGGDITGIPYRDVEVVRDPAGPATLRLHGRAADAFAERGGKRLHLSLSHERSHAVATVIIED